jgi:hypothetical protein
MRTRALDVAQESSGNAVHPVVLAASAVPRSCFVRIWPATEEGRMCQLFESSFPQ